MACPFFFPVEALAAAGERCRPPLGRLYRGECRCEAVAAEPDAACLTESCNWGYARGRCSRFPDGEAADAVRFTARPDAEGGLEIRWAVLHGHLPGPNGVSFSIQTAAGLLENDVLSAQIRAYRDSCLAAMIEK